MTKRHMSLAIDPIELETQDLLVALDYNTAKFGQKRGHQTLRNQAYFGMLVHAKYSTDKTASFLLAVNRDLRHAVAEY